MVRETVSCGERLSGAILLRRSQSDYLREKAAPTARPSAKLCTASPTMTMRLELGMAQQLLEWPPCCKVGPASTLAREW